MQTRITLFLAALAFIGCAKEEREREISRPVSLESLAVTVSGNQRSYMQSDRTGAFLIGSVCGKDNDVWSIDGHDVVRSFSVVTSRGALRPDEVDSAIITPLAARRYYRDGTRTSVEGLELPGATGLHAFVVTVDSAPPGTIQLRLDFFGQVQRLPQGRNVQMESWRLRNGADVFLTAGEQTKPASDGVSVRTEGSSRFLVVFVEPGANKQDANVLYGRIDSIRTARKDRLQRILNQDYIRTSDDTLTLALSWVRLSLDALVIERRDTMAVAQLPWDGSFDVRAAIQSIPGLGLVVGDYATSASILSTAARFQDTLQRSPTLGRVAECVNGQKVTYKGADVASWWARELYEYVSASNDTAVIRRFFPLLRRSVDGTRRGHTDKYNFLLHRPGETWMSDVNRGSRSVEVECLWYYQQLIASLVSSFLGDSIDAYHFDRLAEITAHNLRGMFSDRASKRLADYLREDGTRAEDVRPNAIMCIDLLETDSMRLGVVRSLVKNLLTTDGVATLNRGDPRYGTGSLYNGPVWTWLAGPMTYALTRLDRQDLSFQVTRSMARLALTGYMVGTLPNTLLREPRGGHASLLGMAEFLRSMYQDYLGLRMVGSSQVLMIQPKFPDELTEADATIHVAGHAVTVGYRRSPKDDRILIDAPDLPKPLRVSFLWMLRNGDAWRGSTSISAGVPCTIVMTNDDIVLFQGDEEAKLDAKRQLRNFSQRKLTADLGTTLPPPWGR
jgi:glycogen debranching enzyme